jgi:hypothetical protein
MGKKNKNIINLVVKIFSFAITIPIISGTAFAADGSGTNNVSPTSTTVGSTSGTYTFTFTATENMNSGGIQIQVPSGFSAPQGLAGTAGYTTATSASGIIATVKNNMDSATGWSGGTACATAAPVATTTIKQEGSASVVCRNGNESSGDVWYNNLSATENWSAYTTVGFWIYSSNSIANNNLQFSYDDNANLASPIASLNLGAVAANTWAYKTLTLSGTRTSVASYGFRISNNNGLDNRNVYIDDILLGPGSPTFSGNNIDVRFLTLTSPQTAVVTYGSGGGTSGVTAPSNSGVYTATTTARISDGGILTNIVSHPTITVNNPVPVLTSISPTSTIVGGSSFVLTANGSSFISSSVINWNGLPLTTTFISSSQIAATVPSGNIASTGTSTVAVFTGTPGGGTSSAQIFTVNKANQATLTTVATPSTVQYGATSTLSSTGGSGTGAVTFSVGASTGCSISGGTTLNVINASGSCSVTATKAADANYNIATSSPITIILAAKPITVTANNASKTYGTTDPTFTYSSSDPGAVFTGSLSREAGESAGVYAITQGTLSAGTNYSITFIGASLTINNPVPVLNSVSPTSTFAGGSDFVLTAVGSNFVPSSVIGWNGSDLATTYVSTSTLSATVPALNIASAGTSSVTIFNSTPGGGTSGSRTFTIIDPVATSFSLSPESATMGAGTRLRVIATRLNVANNPTTYGNNTVYLYTSGATSTSRFYDSASGGSQITSVSINSGTSTAVFWYYDEIPGSRTLTASDNAVSPDGVTGITDGTTSITVNVGATTQVSINDVSSLIAGDRAMYTVTRKDQVGNLVSSGLTNLYLYTNATTTGKFYNAASGGSQITSVSILDGSTSTDFWYYDELAGTKTVTVSDNSTAPDGSTGIIDATDLVAVNAGSVAQFTLSGAGSMYARTRSGFTVLRKDAFGNSISNGTTTVYLYTNSSSGNAKFYNDSLAGSQIASINIGNGQTTGSFWYYDDASASTTVTASDNPTTPDGATGVADGTHIISVLPVATKFVISGASSGSVDSAVSITIQAQKPDGSVDGNYQSDVTLNTSGSATGGGIVDIINGVGSKNISDTLAEAVNLSLSDTELTGLDITSTHQIAFSAGALAQFTLSNVVSTGAGVRAEYTVTRKDQYGNLISSGSSSTVYLYSNSSGTNDKFYDAPTGGNIITSIQIPSGQSSASFWYYDDTLGTWTVTASDNPSSPDGNSGVADALDSIQITPGQTAVFEVNNPGSMTAGTRLGYTVSRKDAFGNLVSTGSQNVYLYSTSVSTSTAFYGVAVGGSPETFAIIPDGSTSVDFWYTDGVPGTYTLTMSDNGSAPDGSNGIVDAARSVQVLAAPIVATRFVIIDPGSATVDAPVTVTVQAQDDSGNIDTSNNQSVTLNTTGSATGGGVVSIVNGVGTKNISDIVAQTVNLTLTDTGGTGLNVSSSRSLTFSPGATAQFALSSLGEMSAGTRQMYTVTRKDQFGNGATSGLTKVYLYTASASANAKFYEAASGGSAITFVDITAGSTSTNFWYYDEKAATTTVTVSDNGTSPDGLSGIADASVYQRVVASSIDKFVVNNPGNMFAGTRLGYSVSRKDAYDNLVTSGANIVYLYTNSSGTNKKFYDSSSGGLAVTLAVIDDGNSSANFWYYDDEPGTWVITVSDNISAPDGNSGVKDGAQNVTVSLVPIVATRLVLQAPSVGTVGSPVAISVQAEDNNGNIDTTFAGQVTINLVGAATGGGVVSIVNGVGVSSVTGTSEGVVNLSLTDSGSTGLDVSSVASITFSSTPVLQPGFTGGGTSMLVPTPVIGGVTLSGRAYPGAKLNVLAIGEDTKIIRQSTIASASGNFDVTFKGIGEGEKAYGLLVQDKDGRSAQAKTFDINLVSKSNTINVLNILVSPTIGFTRATVTKGDRLTVVGYAAPGATVEFEVDDKPIIEKATADSSGFYKVLLRTGDLELGNHDIRSRQTGVLGKTSDYSPQKVFNVSSLLVPQVDFNNDSKVDVRDWSIFLARWNSKDPNVRILDDLNGDGKVDVSDFSIFARTLRR